MRSFSLALVTTALPCVIGVFQQHYDAVPVGYEPLQTTGGTTTRFTVALALKNTDQIESKLLALSTPGSPEYGQYLDMDDVQALFGPTDDAVSSVTTWLESAGITDHVSDGLFINFNADVNTANNLLNSSYQLFDHGGVAKLRTLSYTIPPQVENHIALIEPGIYFGQAEAVSIFPSPNRMPAAAAAAAPGPPKVLERQSGNLTNLTTVQPTVDPACATILTPACVKQLCNVGNYTPLATSGSRIGFGSFLNESVQLADFYKFQTTWGIPPQNITLISIDNGTISQDINDPYIYIGEANLDAQNILGVVHPLPIIQFATGGSPPAISIPSQPTAEDNLNEPWLPYFQYLSSRSNEELPQVISNSYSDQEDGVPFDYATHTCNLIALLGMRGITIIQSSGDGGVGRYCIAADFVTPRFPARFPASCPYTTTVGGTVSVNPQIAWKSSGGGFSRYFSRPNFQQAAVTEYLKTVSAETFQYYGQYNGNWSGRAWPDVSTASIEPYYPVTYNGTTTEIGGTSGGAPVWAGLVGLLNDARFRANKSSMGFINPLLYVYGPQGKGLIDLVDGYSEGCQQNITGARYNATPGWDTVTGWGLPDFMKLKDLVLSL